MILAESVATDLFRAVLQGAPPGTVYALVAIGFVLAYKTSGVFNLAFGAQAYVSAVVYFKTHTEWGWGVLPSVLVSVVVLAPLLGVVLEGLVFRHLRTAPPVSKLVVTIGLSVALPEIVALAINFRPRGGAIPKGVVPDGNSVFYDPFGVYAFNRNELVAMAIAVVGAAALAALFRFSAIGLQMRAVVESPRMTELNGVAADRVSVFAWALSSLFAGTAGVLIAPRFSTLSSAEYFNIVVVAVAAAAVGRLVSLPRALFVGGLGLGILIAVFNTFMPRWSDDFTWLRPIQDNVTPAIPFLVLFGILVFVPSVRRSTAASDPLSGVDPPPASMATARRSPKRTLILRSVAAAAAVALGITVFTQASSVWIFLVSQALASAVIYLSVVVITGFGGHISLSQGAFAAIGAFAVYQLADRYDMPVLLAAGIGAVIAAAVGALLSLPIRRLNGIWVAIATLAFAYFFDSVMVKFSWVGGDQPTQRVPRPTLGPFDFDNDKSFLALCLVTLTVVAIVVTQFRKGTLGRTLAAVRGSEVAAQSIGISPGQARIVAFAFSAAIAAIGGALLVMQQENVNYGKNFLPFGALFWLVLVMTMGARSVGGAIAAGAAFSLFKPVVLDGELFAWILRSPDRIPGFLPVSPSWLFILFGLGTIGYARNPEGVIEKTRADMQRLFGHGDPDVGAADALPDSSAAPDEIEETVG